MDDLRHHVGVERRAREVYIGLAYVSEDRWICDEGVVSLHGEGEVREANFDASIVVNYYATRFRVDRSFSNLKVFQLEVNRHFIIKDLPVRHVYGWKSEVVQIFEERGQDLGRDFIEERLEDEESHCLVL